MDFLTQISQVDEEHEETNTGHCSLAVHSQGRSCFLTVVAAVITQLVPLSRRAPSTAALAIQVFMRALFHYDPREDRAIPCQEAGLPFQRRQVLEVVSQDDPTWWQAKRVGDTNLRAGLIPSKQFQER